MRIDIESLRAFARVAEAGGVTRAAETLNLSQSAVSWKLKRLERRLGRPLLRREGQRMAPTDDGRALLDHAERILSAHDAALALFRPSDLAGRLRLGVTEDVMVSHLAAATARFARRHPAVALTSRIEQSLVLRRWLADGEIDLAMMQLLDREVRARDLVLWRDELVWAGPAAPLPDRGASLALVTFGPNCFYRPIAAAALTAAGRRFHVALECPSAVGVKAAVAQGMGVTVINRRHLDDRLRALPDPPAARALPSITYVARAGTARPSRTIRALMEELARACAAGNGRSRP